MARSQALEKGAPMSRDEQMEREANEFAMRLLVPDKFLAKENLDFDLADDEGLAKLAKKYQVSMGVMMIRIEQFRKSGEQKSRRGR